MEIKNKKAYFDYYIESELEAGIALVGTEIKSIRKGSAQLKDSYVVIKNNEAFVINMYIAKYEEGNMFNHDELRTRKLLLHKKEIKKLKEIREKERYSLVPLKLYIKRGHAKILIGVAKGKKMYDKRQTIKKRDEERESKKYINSFLTFLCYNYSRWYNEKRKKKSKEKDKSNSFFPYRYFVTCRSYCYFSKLL